METKTVDEYAVENRSKFNESFQSAYEPFQNINSAHLTFSRGFPSYHYATKHLYRGEYLYNVCSSNANNAKFSWPTEPTFSHMASSKSGRYLAFAFNPKNSSDCAKLTVYDTHNSATCCKMEVDKEIHSHFWAESNNFKFSPCEKKVLYSAEVSGTSAYKSKFSEYEYREHFGEDFEAFTTCKVFVTDFSTKSTFAVKSFSETHTFGDVDWLPDGKGFMCTAYETTPWRLPMMKNLKCQVYVAFFKNANKDSKQMECDWFLVSDPKSEESAWPFFVTQRGDSDYAFYYGSFPRNQKAKPQSGCVDAWANQTHFNGKTLTSTNKHQFLSQDVEMPNKSGFTGVYGTRCNHLMCKNKFFFNTFNGSTESVHLVDTESFNSTKWVQFSNYKEFIPEFAPTDSMELLDAKDDYFLVKHSSPNSAHKLFMAQWDGENSNEGRAYFKIMNMSTPGQSPYNDAPVWSAYSSNYMEKSYGVFEGKHPYLQNKNPPFSPTPLVVNLHGGPFSVFTTNFSAENYYMTELGFDVLCPNFPFSSGFGYDYMLECVGEPGRAEIEFIVAMLDRFLEKYHDRYDRSRMMVMGISYGGYLTTHFCGQYPSLFKVASCRNPMTNMLHFFTATDVHNWPWAVVFPYKFSYSQYPNDEELAKMKSRSPISYLDNIKTPLLLAVGHDDHRVPNGDSLEFYRFMKAQGKTVKLMYYDGKHGIQPPKSRTDYWISTAMWFCYYLDHNPWAHSSK